MRSSCRDRWHEHTYGGRTCPAWAFASPTTAGSQHALYCPAITAICQPFRACLCSCRHGANNNAAFLCVAAIKGVLGKQARGMPRAGGVAAVARSGRHLLCCLQPLLCCLPHHIPSARVDQRVERLPLPLPACYLGDLRIIRLHALQTLIRATRLRGVGRGSAVTAAVLGAVTALTYGAAGVWRRSRHSSLVAAVCGGGGHGERHETAFWRAAPPPRCLYPPLRYFLCYFPTAAMFCPAMVTAS